MTDVDIRIARDDGLEATVALRWRWTAERGDDVAIDEPTFVAEAAAWARAHAGSHLPHVAVADGRIVGMAWLALTPRVATVHSRDRTSGDLQSCYVVPALRGRGIGGRLVQAVLATATERGAEHVTVHTSAASPAMYERNGFRPSARLLWAEAAVAER